MALCDRCLRSDCPKAAGTGACDDTSLIDVSAFRINGVYTTGLRSRMPPSAIDIGDHHIDALRRYTVSSLVAPELSSDAKKLYNDGNDDAAGDPWWHDTTGTLEELRSFNEIFKRHPTQRAVISAKVQDFTLAGPADAAGERMRGAAERVLRFMEDWVEKEGKANKPLTAASSAEYEDRKLPLARLWVVITKHRTASKNALASKLTLTDGKFSKESGTQLTEFEAMKSVTSATQLSLVIRDFEKAVVLIGANGGARVWQPFIDMIYSLSETKGYCFAHVFTLRALKAIDEDPNLNVVVFMRERFTILLMMFTAEYSGTEDRENDDPNATDSGVGGKKTGSGSKFGPVTQEGYAGVERLQSGNVAYCTPWNQGKECNRGVLKGKHKGKCAYTHKCLKCAGDHRYSDKNEAGEWVCPKRAN